LEFIRILDQLPSQQAEDPEQLYIGLPAEGNALPFRVRPKQSYCQGKAFYYQTIVRSLSNALGMGYIVSKSVLQKFGPSIPSCRKNAPTHHSDVEIGRCISKSTQLKCTANYAFHFAFQTMDSDGWIRQKNMNRMGQTRIMFPIRPPTAYFGHVCE
jgi:hypothetical protein